jgi:hypothetical protein
VAEAIRARRSWRRRIVLLTLIAAAAVLGYWAGGLVDFRGHADPPPAAPDAAP